MESNHENEIIFTEVELENISGFCVVLQKIRTRLISEGYTIEELKNQFYDQNIL